MESSTAGDIGAYVFLIALFLVLFGVPLWLMVRHYKKSKPKIAAEKEAYNRLPKTEKQTQKRKGYANLAGVVGMVFGVFIGSRLEMLVVGVIFGIVFGGSLRFVAEKALRV